MECYNKVDIDELTKKIKEQNSDVNRIAKIYNNDEIVDKLFHSISNMRPSIDRKLLIGYESKWRGLLCKNRLGVYV